MSISTRQSLATSAAIVATAPQLTIARQNYAKVSASARRAALAILNSRSARRAAQYAGIRKQDIDVVMREASASANIIAADYDLDEGERAALESITLAPIKTIQDKAAAKMEAARAAERAAYHRIGLARVAFDIDYFGVMQINLDDPDIQPKGSIPVGYLQLSQEIEAALEHSDLTKAERAELDKGYTVIGGLSQELIAALAPTVFDEEAAPPPATASTTPEDAPALKHYCIYDRISPNELWELVGQTRDQEQARRIKHSHWLWMIARAETQAASTAQLATMTIAAPADYAAATYMARSIAPQSVWKLDSAEDRAAMDQAIKAGF